MKKTYEIGRKYSVVLGGERMNVTCTGMLDDCAYCNGIIEGFTDIEKYIFGDIEELNDGTIREA